MSEEDRADSPGANAGSSASAATVAMRSNPDSRQSGPGAVSESAHLPVEATDDDPSEVIDRVFKQRDSRALKYFRRRLNLTVFAVALGPVAVLLLATQIISFPKGGFFASILIASELVVLSVALAVGFLQMGRTHRVWIRERLRAEILRREGFLLRMRVGPYLKVAERALA